MIKVAIVGSGKIADARSKAISLITDSNNSPLAISHSQFMIILKQFYGLHIKVHP